MVFCFETAPRSTNHQSSKNADRDAERRLEVNDARMRVIAKQGEALFERRKGVWGNR